MRIADASTVPAIPLPADWLPNFSVPTLLV
jgi:hypothetical protein